MFLLVFWSPKQVNTEESYEESWAKLRSHLPRVNPDCKEKKQRESAMKPILDDSRISHFWSTFLKSKWCMLYTISNLRKSTIQCFKWCAIRSWNEEVSAITNQSLRAEGSILQSVAKTPFCCEVISQHFCTVRCFSFWRCMIYAVRRKLGTLR